MRKLLAMVALGLSALVGSAPAQASIWVDFSFTGTNLEPGTITGRLEFADTGVNVQAVALYIDSAPSRMFVYPNDNLLASLHSRGNSFTITADGTVTAANLDLYGTDPAQTNNTDAFFQLNGFGGYNDYSQDFAYPYPFGSSFSAVSNQAGFGGATYTIEAAEAVPEAASWMMMIGGFALVGTAMRNKRGIIPNRDFSRAC